MKPVKNKQRKKPLHLESLIQTKLIETWNNLPNNPYKGLLYSVPNGGKRSQREAGILKAEGVVSGIPDLFLAVPNNYYNGFYIEMKKPGGDLGSEQRVILPKLVNEGYAVGVFDCVSFALLAIQHYLDSQSSDMFFYSKELTEEVWDELEKLETMFGARAQGLYPTKPSKFLKENIPYRLKRQKTILQLAAHYKTNSERRLPLWTLAAVNRGRRKEHGIPC